MNIVPMVWFFRRQNSLPLVEGIGECSDKYAQPIMLAKALEFIKIAENFEGIPSENFTPNYNSKKALCVSFTLMFPSEEKLHNFVEFMQSRN